MCVLHVIIICETRYVRSYNLVTSRHFSMTLYVAGTMHTVLIKGGVLVSGVVLCALYVAGTMHTVLIKGGLLVSGVVLCVLYVAGAMHMYIVS